MKRLDSGGILISDETHYRTQKEFLWFGQLGRILEKYFSCRAESKKRFLKVWSKFSMIAFIFLLCICSTIHLHLFDR